MLETIMENQVMFYFMGIAVGLGVLSKMISQITLRRVVREAGKMSKSNHTFMRLVKAKFEHASMISDKVQNVQVFVRKYIYEYKVFGVRLNTWRRLEQKSIWAVAILGTLATAAGYGLYGMEEVVFQYGAWTAAGVIVLFLIHSIGDEKYQLQMMENYMVDFLENVCAHRYAKMYHQKDASKASIVDMKESFEEKEKEEMPVVEEETSEIDSSEIEFLEKELAKMEPSDKPMFQERESQEVRIREILEEFLA